MKGTALLINKDQTVTVLENVEHVVYEDLASLGDSKNIKCTINDKEIQFDPIDQVVCMKKPLTGNTGINL
jgi:hypothetical protein